MATRLTRSTLLVAALMAASAASGLAVAPAAGAASAPPSDSEAAAYSSHGEVRNILPPGSNGNVVATDTATLGVTSLPNLFADPSNPKGDLATATPTTPAHFADQLETYDALNKVASGALTDAQLPSYFKDAKLGVADADVVSTENPEAGLVIKRDKDGVPHVFGQTDAEVEYGAGIANIEDRMFLTDVLRNTGKARMAEFLGPTDGDIAQDRAQLLVAPYTDAQLEDQINQVVKRYGAEGQALKDRAQAYIDGMNAEIAKLCPLSVPTPLPGPTGAGFGPQCPVEYAALGRPPQPYTIGDIVAIGSLVAGRLGKGGGGELDNALWLQSLVAKYGLTEGLKVYDDLREKDDPEAPTTSPVADKQGVDHVQPGLPGVALPDIGGPSAPGTSSDAGGTTVPLPSTITAPTTGVAGDLTHLLTHDGMSNALLVDAKHGDGGHPVAVIGPQTGYYAPQLLSEIDLEGPHIRARGVSFAGTSLVVELGHGVDYAWSATSSDDDVVDVVADRLCTTDGSAVTVNSTSYLVNGACTPMETFVHSETALPGIAGTAPPQQINLLVLKTRHGIVQKRVTVKGVPVALSLDRSTYGHEIDSIVGFARANDPTYVHDAASFTQAFSAVDYTFNWFYVDDKDIAYYNSALIPKRSTSVDNDLPRWGDATYDPQGYLTTAQHPQVINPSTGYLVSWNNKQAPGFALGPDEGWSFGAVYRSLTLSDRVKGLVAAGQPVTRARLAGAMIDAATVDVRANYVLPYVLDVIGTPSDPNDAAAVGLLRQWIADGSHRVDRARTGAYDHQAAVDLLDTWWDSAAAGAGGTVSLPEDWGRGTLGDLVDQLPQGHDDHPRQGLGSAWNGVSWYGYLSKDLRALLGHKVQGAYSRAYCGGGTLAGCRSALQASLHGAVALALSTGGVSSVSALTFDKTKDDIVHVAAGVTGVRAIDWQNRPTFQQVIRFSSHRARPATAAQAGKKSSKKKSTRVSAPTSLAATGGPSWPPLLAAVLLGSALGGRLLRQRRLRR